MRQTLTIGKLAGQAGVPATTLRYYERTGLLVPRQRSASNYRLYEPEDLDRLRFIRAAQAIGFTLDDIRVLMGLERGTTKVCGNVQDLIEERLTDVARRMKDLRQVQKTLRSSLERCKQCGEVGHCEVIEGLAEGRAKKNEPAA